jgi:aminopeptidase N
MLENDFASSAPASTIYLKDYQPSDFFIRRVNLDISLGEHKTIVHSELEIERNGEHDRPLCLDGEKLVLLSLELNGQALELNSQGASASHYVLGEESLSIHNVPNNFKLMIVTELEPHLNTELSGLYQSSGNFCTQCEAQGFRRISYFLDRPDVLAVYQVRMTASKTQCPVLLANGNLLDQGQNGDGTHWAVWSDPHPKPSYLFALVAGDLESIQDHFTTCSGNTIELNIYTQEHNIDKCQHAMESLQKSMRWDEQVYGREYDLEVYNIVAVDDFNMGAMENKGLNVFNSKYVLAKQDTATDNDYEGIESVIGHEYFHNWSGNRVTCRDWFQLSLKEGFTVFRDQEFSADQGSRTVKRIRDVQVLRAHQFKEDAGPMAHPVRPESYQEINNFYTVTIYEKGAEVIRMMHSMVGVQGFRKASDLYFDRFDGQAVTTEDFVQCMEQANDLDLSQFRLWYTQSGTPEVRVKQTYNNGRLSLDLEQSCPPTPNQEIKKPFLIPIKMAVFSISGSKLRETTLLLSEAQQSFHFDDLPEQSIVSLLRDFSAPVKLQFAQSDEELAALIKVDDNGFARWEAMQRLSLNALLPAIANGEVNQQAYQGVLESFRSVIKSKEQDLALKAEMLTLPSTAYLSEQLDHLDPQAVSAVRKAMVVKLAADLEPELETIYTRNRADHFSLSAEAMAQRALKNTCLAYLVASEKPRHIETAHQQYQAADNMTDRLAAFTYLVHSVYPEKQALVDDFYKQWKGDTLVLDKWFAIQAMSPQDNVLSEVKSLMSHPAFSLRNPNKVRSLLGAFASNSKGFHQPDGKAYEFIGQQIIALNQINPQIAARMASVFNNWKRLAQPYSSLMLAQLQNIQAHSGLSKDVAEIVDKALSNN